MSAVSPATNASPVDSGYAWLRLVIVLATMTIASSGMYVVVVVLPAVQAEFGVARADASLPYTLTMIGFGIGGILMGRLSDRYGVALPLAASAICLAAGYALASYAGGIVTFAIVHGVLIGLLGSSASFAPLMADTSFWFERRRGIAVAICASGNYLAGALWPPVIQHFVTTIGWRQTYLGMALFCLVTVLPLSWLLRRRRPAVVHAPGAAPVVLHSAQPLGMSPGALQTLLSIAGVACCVAMAMPQVHIVAYCGDLGYGAARGAQMLSLMLGFGIVSRLVFGLIADRIGGLRTLLLGSTMQAIALVLFLPFDSLASLYLISALFGLFQGGIVPQYAMVVRQYFAPREAGERVGVVLMATLLGMALGGWLSGKIFDVTGSYDAAFINGIGWNLLNIAIIYALLRRSRRLDLDHSRLEPA